MDSTMTNYTTQDRISDLRNRMGIYRVLAEVIRKEITRNLADGMARAGFFRTLAEAGYSINGDAFRNDSFLQELRVEFTRVFHGPGPHVAPYGSVHHPGDPKRGRLWGDTTIWVRRFVKDHGLEFGGKGDKTPDHIGHEFEFFSRLLEREAKALEDGDEETADRLRNSRTLFFREQLEKWVPIFCQKVLDRAEVPFYHGMAKVTSDLIQTEGALLDAGGPE